MNFLNFGAFVLRVFCCDVSKLEDELATKTTLVCSPCTLLNKENQETAGLYSLPEE